MRAFVLLSALIQLSACQTFYPSYDAVVGTQTEEAYKAVSEFLSAVELGKYEQAASYSATIDAYAAIDGKLAIAQLRAEQLPAGSKISREARDEIARQIGDCRKQIAEVRKRHIATGLIVDVGGTQPARNACDQAARAANAMRE